MAIKKLADGPLVLTITSSEIVDGNYGTQCKFVGLEPGAAEDTVVYVSERSAIRQLDRIGMTMESCVGSTIRMEHINKDGRTYTNFALSDADAVAPNRPAVPAQPTPVAQRPASIDQVDAAAGLYKQCLAIAYNAIAELSEDVGIQFSSSDIVAATATLYIQMNKR